MRRHLALLFLPLLLLGCATPYPATVTDTDIRDFNDVRSEFADRGPINGPLLPSGSVTYQGQFGGDLSVNGTTDYGLLGDMTMTVDFGGGDGSVTGELTDINLLEGRLPNQRLGGSMQLNGTVTDGTLDARATGNLSAVSDRLPVRGDADIALNLDGQVVEDGANTAVTGTISGTTSADADYQLSVQNGFFYGTELPEPPLP